MRGFTTVAGLVLASAAFASVPGPVAMRTSPPGQVPSTRSTLVPEVAQSNRRLVGVWRVVRFCGIDSTGTVTQPLGEHPTGLFVYTPSGYLSLHAMRTPSVPPFDGGDFAPTGPEARALLQGYFGYFGTYTITSDSTVVHHVIGGTIPSYIGTDQLRYYRIRPGNPDTLSIGGYPVPMCRILIRVG